MSVTIFRKINGRIVPIIVDEEHASEYLKAQYKKTPKHHASCRKFDTNISFTVPNAICQSCGKAVFYYENSHGSRVLFDFLGPPWPVHPCYSAARITESKENHVISPGWEPVIVDRGVITSNGGLRVQGALGVENIRFFFEASIFSKMKIDVSDTSGLIVFASRDKQRVQTHTGNKIFMSRYEVVPDTRVSEINIPQDSHAAVIETRDGSFTIEVITNETVVAKYVLSRETYLKYFLKNKQLTIKTIFDKGERIDKARSDSHGMFITLNELSSDMHPSGYEHNNERNFREETSHLVGTLIIKNFEIVVDKNERMTAIVSGSLNKEFRVTYVLSDNSQVNEAFNIFGKKTSPGSKNKCFVRDSKDNITLEVPVGEDKIVEFNVRYVKKSIADKMIRLKSEINSAENKKTLVIHKKKKTLPLENHIDRLGKTINSSMADAFINARKK